MANKLTFQTHTIQKIQVVVEVEVDENLFPDEDWLIREAMKVDLSAAESEIIQGATFSTPSVGHIVNGKCKVTFYAEKAMS